MDPVSLAGAAGTLDKIGARDGFLAVLVLVQLVGFGLALKWFMAALKTQRDECREERKEDRDAHGAAYAALTDEFKELRRELTPTGVQRLRGG